MSIPKLPRRCPFLIFPLLRAENVRLRGRGFVTTLGMAALMLGVGWACGTPPPAEGPVIALTEPPTEAAPVSAGGWTTFADENGFLQVDVPADWKHSRELDTRDGYWYWDAFTSPDGHAHVDSIVYDDGTTWMGAQSSKQALYVLDEFYSLAAEAGDIRVSDDSMQKDGSERLTWSSRGGSYSGISFFEVRAGTTFLMFTVWWDHDYRAQYGDLLDQIVQSYQIP